MDVGSLTIYLCGSLKFLICFLFRNSLAGKSSSTYLLHTVEVVTNASDWPLDDGDVFSRVFFTVPRKVVRCSGIKVCFLMKEVLIYIIWLLVIHYITAFYATFATGCHLILVTIFVYIDLCTTFLLLLGFLCHSLLCFQILGLRCEHSLWTYMVIALTRVWSDN